MQAGALDKTVLKALDFHFGTERPEQIAELTAEGYKALQETERRSCAKKTGAVACVEAVLALAICEVHAYVFNGLDVHGVPRSDCQQHTNTCRTNTGAFRRTNTWLSALLPGDFAQPHDPFRGLACVCWQFLAHE